MPVAVIGGGAAGMAAAYAAASNGAKVTIFDQNEKLGKKLFISGKGRCNLTNASEIDNHLANVVRNPRFLYSAYNAFSPSDLMALIQEAGTPLKVERGARVFPQSDKSSDILAAWKKLLKEVGAEVILGVKVLSLEKTADGFDLLTSAGAYHYDRVIVCTGGITYQATGSTGDGYRFATSLGHTVTELLPGLVGIRADLPKELAGLSLKNVRLSALCRGKEVITEFGELLFTHTGISGPIVLTISSKINRLNMKEVKLLIDLKPALSEETLDARLLRDFSDGINKTVKTVLTGLMPRSLISLVLSQAKTDGNLPCHSVTKEQRRTLCKVIKEITVNPIGPEDRNGAIITSGGVDVREINAKDMQSKIVPGLYFAGEVIDVDALTGGYNLQIAFSTGYLAGRSAANG